MHNMLWLRDVCSGTPVFKPVMIHNFLQSVRLLSDSIGSFVHYCLSGLQVSRTKIDYFVNRSLHAGDTAQSDYRVRQVRETNQLCTRTRSSLREANEALKFVSDEEFQKLVRPEAMTKPG